MTNAGQKKIVFSGRLACSVTKYEVQVSGYQDKLFLCPPLVFDYGAWGWPRTVDHELGSSSCLLQIQYFLFSKLQYRNTTTCIYMLIDYHIECMTLPE